MSDKIISNYKELQMELQQAIKECAQLREENARLKALLGLQSTEVTAPAKHINLVPPIPNKQHSINVTNNFSPKEKISFFRSLFRGRDDVYPIRWEGKVGKAGYSPVCANEWDKRFCKKPKIKCAECDHRKLVPLTDQAIHNHLIGKQVLGVYPLLPDETCWFLAADFDKTTWKDDSSAFLETCYEMGISAALERSRSGNGAHIWIFFSEPISASVARKLGFIILTRTMETKRVLNLDSYDRFFPNQDTMPKGGFGNLIALPLQYAARANNNSLFLDHNFQPYEDQWFYLSSITKMSGNEVQSIVETSTAAGNIIGVRQSFTDMDKDEDPWTLPPSKKMNDASIPGPLPKEVKIVYSNMIYIVKKDMPPAMINRLMRIAAFQNPDFYKTQAMRLPTYDKPLIICCADDFPKHLGLPRGCLHEVIELFREHDISFEITDERSEGKPINVNFNGELSDLQFSAGLALSPFDNGILSTTTAFGKTVMAAWLIGMRKVNTLVLVHRRQLMDQWKERLSTFLDIPNKSIGQIGGGKDKRTGFIDIGIIQSLSRKGAINDIVADYGQIIVDECHHVSAFSFEQVLKHAKAKYVLGLTATPVRKDGHHPIVVMQCGPIRFRVDAKNQAKTRPFDHIAVPRYTNFKVPDNVNNPKIQDIYASIISDKDRNNLIFDDLLKALDEGRSPLLLTERTDHVEYFAERLKGFAKNIIVLRGGMGKKQRKALNEQLASIPDNEERVLISTGRYIGEGFDDSRLDTLFLVMPISWHGTLQQYAGRLHRIHHSKQTVQVYDYVDCKVPMLQRMYDKRVRGYKAMGYNIGQPNSSRNYVNGSLF